MHTRTRFFSARKKCAILYAGRNFGPKILHAKNTAHFSPRGKKRACSVNEWAWMINSHDEKMDKRFFLLLNILRYFQNYGKHEEKIKILINFQNELFLNGFMSKFRLFSQHHQSWGMDQLHTGQHSPFSEGTRRERETSQRCWQLSTSFFERYMAFIQ